MSQQIRCPHCSNLFATPPGAEGQVVACPYCQGQLRVPAIAQATPPARPPTRPPSQVGGSPAATPVSPAAGATDFAPVVQDPAISSTTERLRQRRNKSPANIVLYILVPVTVVALLGLTMLLVYLMSGDDDGGDEGPSVPSGSGYSLVGKWELDLDALVRIQVAAQGGGPVEEATAKQMLEGMGMKMDFDFKKNGRMTLNAVTPEGSEQMEGGWSTKNKKGKKMDIIFDVEGEFLDEKLSIEFLDRNSFKGDFGGETIVFKRK